MNLVPFASFFTALLPFAPYFTATAILAGSIVAFFGLRHERRQSEEPWSVRFRELHRDFWNDEEVAKARMLISCDAAYKELCCVLDKRLMGRKANQPTNPVSPTEYELLERLDRFFAIMLRVTNVSNQQMKNKQRQTWERLGYDYWLAAIKKRDKLYEYAFYFWNELIEEIDDAAVKVETKTKALERLLQTQKV